MELRGLLPSQPSLGDLASESLLFAASLGQGEEVPQEEALRTQAARLLEAFANAAEGAGHPAEQVEQASYALIALIDERILTSEWALKSAWMAKPLQLERFGSFAAGEEFYTRLEGLPPESPAGEVFALCLGIGFTGKHVGVAGIEARRKLLQGLLPPGELPPLAPNWRADVEQAPRERELPLKPLAAACLLVTLLVYSLCLAFLEAELASLSLGS